MIVAVSTPMDLGSVVKIEDIEFVVTGARNDGDYEHPEWFMELKPNRWWWRVLVRVRSEARLWYLAWKL